MGPSPVPKGRYSVLQDCPRTIPRLYSRVRAERVACLCEMYTAGLCPEVPNPNWGALGVVDLGCGPKPDLVAFCQFGAPDIVTT